jgi:hypothetical protein
MRCPLCDKEIPGHSCPRCGLTVPEGAKYCMDCGASLVDAEADFVEDDSEFDFENRVLCADDACTGIIVDGRCTECGKEFREA